MIEPSWLLAYRTPELTAFFKLCPFLASGTFFLTVIALGLWRAPRSDLFASLAFLVPLSTLLNGLLKNSFQIPRPPIELRLIPVFDPFGMPSGDVQIATVFWLSCALASGRLSMKVLSGMIVLTIAISRVYLGVHSIADVTVAIFIGLGTLAVWRRASKRFWRASQSLYWKGFAGLLLLQVLQSFIAPTTPMALMSLGALLGFGLAKPDLRGERDPMSWSFCVFSLCLLILVSYSFPLVTYSYALLCGSFALKYTVLTFGLLVTMPSLFERFQRL
jgi:membrane-associated phospholipid phosphatase